MKNEERNPNKGKDSKLSDVSVIILTILGVLFIITSIAMPFIVRNYYKSRIEDYKTLANIGAVGDFIGGTTVAFLTASSVVLLLATIIMQRKEIKISQQSIEQLVEQTKSSVEQAQEARKETQITNDTMKKQQFETTFFNMLNLIQQIVNNMRITEIREDEKEYVYIGREVIKRLRMIYEKVLSFNPPSNGYITQAELDKLYKEFHDEFGNDIGHYMRFNYRIVKFIVNNIANDENEQKKIKEETGRETIIGDRRYYFGMLRAQWSNAEFELILINSLYSENHKFKKLILRYDVLDIDMEDKENEATPEVFKLKDSMKKFKAYRKLIEVNKYQQ
ncbi:putative phage abortive infection protein [Priestia megaterium]|uniref:putative phage abortive infection protein n=1 Tax=Priestia megaterium TaxID=1404 RepID=UPI0030C8F93F